jgi:PAS domain S-box-containing protein
MSTNSPLPDPPLPTKLVNVGGPELLAGDTREQYRQKLARITLDSMVQFVGLLDANGTVLEINQVALDGVGIKLSDVEGKPFWTTFWWQVSDEINQGLRESILRASRGEFVRWDTEIYGRAGGKETIIIDASLMPVKDEQGNVVFITAEGRDITEKKAQEREIARQREELARLDVLKTQFFTNISHEFRTPLTLMLGPLEDALANAHGILPAGAAADLATSHRNALRLLKLVNTMLDFSRIEAGRMQASYQPTDLAALTADLASNFRSVCEKAGLRLIVDCPPLSPSDSGRESAYVDRDMWEKIVLNLLSNAFKFTLQGEITVRLETVDGRARLTVRDTGVGIPGEELPHIFERFHRIERSLGRTKARVLVWRWCRNWLNFTAGPSPPKARRVKEALSRLAFLWAAFISIRIVLEPSPLWLQPQ